MENLKKIAIVKYLMYLNISNKKIKFQKQFNFLIILILNLKDKKGNM